MMLGKMLNGCEYVSDTIHMDKEITGVAYNSRNVKEGYLFVAIKGEHFDGHDFIKDAIEKGATAIAVEDRRDDFISEIDQAGLPISVIRLKNSRETLACIANNFYERPSERTTLIGITGTNGKTTTTYILKSILESWGRTVGLIGTIKYMIGNTVHPALHTTPESLEFQSLLRTMHLSGCTHIVTEVSSHALTQQRVDRSVFRAAVFTNLTRDHLDFHKNMEEYFRAKERLFTEMLSADGTAVVNIDDQYGKRLIQTFNNMRGRTKILTCGLEPGADITARDIENTLQGLKFKLVFQRSNYIITSPLIGIPNVYNILSAVGVSIALDIPWEAVIHGIAKTDPVQGRFEKVDVGQDFFCVVDYAHTEDALARLIQTARELLGRTRYQTAPPSPPSPPFEAKGGGPTSGSDVLPRIITAFGCGGDRDKGKRPRMGEVATRLSDVVIITSDNPRSEEPLDIIRDIEQGTVRKNYCIEPDRREAIRKAVHMANHGDIVLIAGKGHEGYQEIKGIRYEFSDRDFLEKTIRERLELRTRKCSM